MGITLFMNHAHHPRRRSLILCANQSLRMGFAVPWSTSSIGFDLHCHMPKARVPNEEAATVNKRHDLTKSPAIKEEMGLRCIRQQSAQQTLHTPGTGHD